LTNGHKTYLYPQWSPDGKKIVMIYGSNENHDVFLIDDLNRPAETLKALTTWDYDDLRPVWSPDGKKIAFYSNYNLENNPKVWSIIVISGDGSDPTFGEGLAEKVVAKNVIPDIEQGPAWMPDSKRIIYVKNDQQTYNPIYMVDIEAKKNLAINTQTKMNHDVACSPDGTLAFRAQVEQWDHIYIARLQEE
jgi:Tol biopolymer transport system component